MHLLQSGENFLEPTTPQTCKYFQQTRQQHQQQQKQDFEKVKNSQNADPPTPRTQRRRKRKHVPHSLRSTEFVAQRNTRERHRAHGVNQALQALRAHVPILSRDHKASKIAIVRHAAEYIMSLTSLLQTVDRNNDNNSDNVLENSSCAASLLQFYHHDDGEAAFTSPYVSAHERSSEELGCAFPCQANLEKSAGEGYGREGYGRDGDDCQTATKRQCPFPYLVDEQMIYAAAGVKGECLPSNVGVTPYCQSGDSASALGQAAQLTDIPLYHQCHQQGSHFNNRSNIEHANHADFLHTTWPTQMIADQHHQSHELNIPERIAAPSLSVAAASARSATLASARSATAAPDSLHHHGDHWVCDSSWTAGFKALPPSSLPPPANLHSSVASSNAAGCCNV